jgi:hypothetical protein
VSKSEEIGGVATEPVDEKTPRSTYQLGPRAGATDAAAWPPPRPRMGTMPNSTLTECYRQPRVSEPSVVVAPSVTVDLDCEFQLDTMTIARRRSSRALELVLVATLSALFAALLGMLLAHTFHGASRNPARDARPRAMKVSLRLEPSRARLLCGC